MDNIIYKIGNIKYLLVFSLLLFLTSCSAEIESASANSTSAILAVCGEYILAIFSLIVLLLIHCIRITGVAISTLAIYMIYNKMLDIRDCSRNFNRHYSDDNRTKYRLYFYQIVFI